MQRPGQRAERAADQQEDEVGHARDQAQRKHDRRDQGQRLGRVEHLAAHLGADVLALADAGDDHRRGHRDQQRRHLGDQGIADGQQDEVVGRRAGAHAVLQRADQEAADDVDEQDQQRGDGVAAHELARAVHRAEELGLVGDLGAAAPGLGLVDVAGGEVGVDGHLLARQRIEREARADFGDALGALGDDHEIDHHQHRKDDQADREVAADQETAEALDDLAGRAGAGVAFGQHDAGRGHVERQPQQRGDQQHRRERGEVQRPHHLRGDHHHDQRQRDVEGEQQVQRQRRQRQHHHRQHQHDEDRHQQRPDGGRAAAEAGAQGGEPAAHRSPPAAPPRCCGSSPGGTASGGSARSSKSPTRPRPSCSRRR